MKSLCRSWMLGALALLLAAPVLAEEHAPFRQEELDQMLAPVALYPDPLLSQVLMASTYPLEVVQAARWSRANPGLKGQDAVRAVEPMDWEPSVKSLTAFPQVLAMMSERLEWTERLGEAFLAQQADVINTVQGLRQRAEAAGHLHSGAQMRVERRGGVILIEPPAPEIVYVPYYDPTVVYGPWWWPGYPPVAWAPPPAYYVVPPYPPAWLWGGGIVLSTGFFFGHFDWPHRHVQVRHVHHHHSHPVHVHRAWRHDPAHRRGVPFRHAGAHPRGVQQRANALVQPAPRSPQWAAPARVETRAQPVSPARSEQRSSQSRDRRSENRETTRPHARLVEPRRAAPIASPASRPAVAAPVARVEPRVNRAVPAAGPQTSQRQARVFEGGRRAETRSATHPQPVIRPSAPAPRAAVPPAPRVSDTRPAPREEASHSRGHGNARGHGNGHQRAPSSAGRDHGRRS